MRVWMGAIVVALVIAAPARAAPGELAYVHGGSVWAEQADGANQRVLVMAPVGRQLAYPRWSPDGTRLAYVSSPDSDEEKAQIVVWDGLTTQPVTPDRRNTVDLAPAWSPDGTKLAFTRFTETQDSLTSAIVVRDLATGGETALVTHKGGFRLQSVGEPSWSPGGAMIAYSLSRLDRHAYFHPQIQIVPAQGGTPRTLIDDAQSPAWSPDGTRLAFAGVRDHHGEDCGSDECSWTGELYTAAVDGKQLKRLTRNTGDDATPAWSPDGSRIVFASDRNLPGGYSQEVYSVAADGSCLTWLTNGTPASAMPAWRPGSGDGFAPASCDPRTRTAQVAKEPKPFTGELWLGPTYRGRLYTHTQRDHSIRIVSYDDCATFTPCGGSVLLIEEPACRAAAYRGLIDNPFRYTREHGALVATYLGGEANVRVFTGAVALDIQLGHRSRKAVRRVIAQLRRIGAAMPPARLAPPRLPKQLAERLKLRGYRTC